MKSFIVITIFLSLTNNSFAMGYNVCHGNNQGECCGEMKKNQKSMEKSYIKNCNVIPRREYLADEILAEFKQKSEKLIKQFGFSKYRVQQNKITEIQLNVK